jgi:ribosomal protein L25 (general stress protein Ctc)
MFQFRFLSITSLLLGFVLFGNAQNVQDTSAKEAAYTKAITERADKIVQKLEVKKEKKALKVRDLIANQYRNLNDIHEQKRIAS